MIKEAIYYIVIFQTIPQRAGFHSLWLLAIWLFSHTVTVIEESCVTTSIVDLIIKH